MKRDLNWERYLTLSQRKYGGKYVVIAGGRLIGAGRNLAPLLRRARKSYPKDIPFVARMRDPRKICEYAAALDV